MSDVRRFWRGIVVNTGVAIAVVIVVSTAVNTGSPTTQACNLTTTRVEAEFAKVPTDPPTGCLTDVLKQDGMCALINGVRSSH